MARHQPEVQHCPTCGKEMTFIELVDFEASRETGQITVPLASSIYRCQEHGRFRVFLNGKTVPLT